MWTTKIYEDFWNDDILEKKAKQQLQIGDGFGKHL